MYLKSYAMPYEDALLQQMHTCADCWEKTGDSRFIFLRCYSFMTGNMQTAIGQHRFHDANWVNNLLEYFAGYYFNALQLYDSGATNTPLVWKLVHDASRFEKLHVLQHLLLGINAHINYDLVLSIYDKIAPEWPLLNEQQVGFRKQDHERVNTIISETIDIVQDEVIEKDSRLMAIVDTLFGRIDEWLLSKLIANWRYDVWEVACSMVRATTASEREAIRLNLEHKVMKTAGMILAL